MRVSLRGLVGRRNAATASELFECARRPDEGRRHLGLDEEGRDLLQVAAEAPFVLEALPKPRAVDLVAETRDDAAANVQATERAEREREVARDGAQQAEEEIHHLDTSCIAAGHGALGDLGGTQALGR